MVINKVRSVALAGGLSVLGVLLAGCGSGSAAGRVATDAASGSPTTTTTTTTTPTPSAGNNVGPVLMTYALDGTINYAGRRPTTIKFSSDSSNIVSHLTWSKWGLASAQGKGLLAVNDCKPNCATGNATQVPVTIDLSNVDHGRFTSITEEAATLTDRFSFPAPWPASAS